MDDLVKRLRALDEDPEAAFADEKMYHVASEAAAEIERLLKERQALRAALTSLIPYGISAGLPERHEYIVRARAAMQQ